MFSLILSNAINFIAVSGAIFIQFVPFPLKKAFAPPSALIFFIPYIIDVLWPAG
jgi:hypothetical protein